jgi:DNA-binding MarR family transcriptional regulator
MSQGRRQVLGVLDGHVETGNAALREALGTDGATLTRLLEAMEADGLVERRRDAADNRLALVALTPAGRESAAALRTARTPPTRGSCCGGFPRRTAAPSRACCAPSGPTSASARRSHDPAPGRGDPGRRDGDRLASGARR